VAFGAATWIVCGLRKANENSFNKKVFDFCVKRRGEDGTGFWGGVAKTVQTCVPVRLARWFFADESEGLAGISFAALFNPKIWYMIFLLGALTVPGPMWNNMYLLLAAFFFAGVFAFGAILRGEKLNFDGISPALVLFVFFCALSIFTGYGGGDSARVFVIFFACVVHSVLVAVAFRGKNDLRIFFCLTAVALVLMSAFGFYQFVAGIEVSAEMTDLGVNPGLSRLYSTMGNPNNDAQAWAMLLPLVLAVAITVKDDTRRLLLFGAIAITVAAFALTFSRAGYVAIMGGLGVFVLISAPRLVPIGLIALVFALPFIPAAILERLFTLGQDTSSQYRFLIWEGVRRMIEDFWVQGIGMGPAAFVRIYRGYAHPAAERAMHAHNQFFDIIAHSGIGALLAFLAYLFRLFKRGMAAYVASADAETKIFISAGLASLAVFVVFGVGEYVWFHPRVMLVFWIVAGVVSAVANHEKNLQ
jgi:O-antigen ligase